MSSAVDSITPAKTGRGIAGRVWAGVVAAWGVISGLAPHVLHHVGPLAGAALLAGFGGKALFFALGLVLSLPLLRRLYRRFQTWLAPALAVLIFIGMFSLSSLVIAPRLTGSEKAPAPGIEQPSAPSGHARHHGGGGK
jgi:hypothetical protein